MFLKINVINLEELSVFEKLSLNLYIIEFYYFYDCFRPISNSRY